MTDTRERSATDPPIRVDTDDAGFRRFKNRNCCTDFLCVILFVGLFIGLAVVFVASVNREPRLLDKLVRPSQPRSRVSPR